MVAAAAAGLCCCCSCCRFPPLCTAESMAGRLAPIRRGVFTAAISGGFLKPLSSLWVGNSSSSSSSRGLTGENRFSPSWALSNSGAVAASRAYNREGDRGRSNSPVAEVYDEYGGQQQLQERGAFPRPAVVAWDKDLANGVQLIGRVGKEITVKYFDTGKVLALTSLAVHRSGKRDQEPSWFELEIWGELAEIANCHVAKGEQILVTGNIVVDKRVKDDVTYNVAKVIVGGLCKVDSYSDRRHGYDESNDEVMVTRSTSQYQEEVSNGGSSHRNWNQHRSPSQPSQVQKRNSNSQSEAALATEKRWQEYFADPTQWWDNRVGKKSPKWPDFKHKSTQDALWIESYSNPPWVAQQLAVLEEKKAQHSRDFGNSSRSGGRKLSSFEDSDFRY